MSRHEPVPRCQGDTFTHVRTHGGADGGADERSHADANKKTDQRAHGLTDNTSADALANP